MGIEDVKEHFSREAKDDIMSVFLMKSNSAFVNYRSREATLAAVRRFDGTSLQGSTTPLKCKMNDKSNERGSTVAAGPMAQATAVEAIIQNREMSARASATAQANEGAQRVPYKYFIMKSLTKEDLETSVRDGVWATQPHNEDGLNKAFHVRINRITCPTLILI